MFLKKLSTLDEKNKILGQVDPRGVLNFHFGIDVRPFDVGVKNG